MEPVSHHLVVPRTARYVTLGSFEGPVEEVWFLLHGYGQLAEEFLGHARALAGGNRLLVAPEGLSRFYHEDHAKVGASWMTREDRLAEIDDYVRYLDLVHDTVGRLLAAASLPLGLLGYSQGVATASRWAVRGKVPISRLVLWGSPLPPELDDETAMARLRRVRVTLVAGSRDPYLTDLEWDRQTSLLERHGVPCEMHRFEGGHRLDDDTLRELAAS